jgi:parvulin-like peptidyl-prolyl isomerase
LSEPKPISEASDDARKPPEARRAQLWLALGAAAGLLTAAAGLMGDAPGPEDLPEGIVARVGDATIRVEEYRRLVAGLEADRREPVDDALRRHVLDRMIDEELLVQRAVELGLVEVDRRVRANLTSAMIQSIVDDAEEIEPSERDLRDFYAENANFFTSSGRLRVRQIFFRMRADASGSSEERAARAHQRLLAGETFEALLEEFGENEIAPLPDALLPALKLREYVGPTVLRAAMELEPGAFSVPVRSGTGLHILKLVDREMARTPDYEGIAEQVRAEWRRRLGDTALRAYLDGLRDDTLVIIALDRDGES